MSEQTKQTLIKQTLIRPVKCYFCNAPMFYAGDERHEPEVRVSINAYLGFNDDQPPASHFYAHVRCWNEKIGK